MLPEDAVAEKVTVIEFDTTGLVIVAPGGRVQIYVVAFWMGATE
jgi:hypothetical protein